LFIPKGGAIGIIKKSLRRESGMAIMEMLEQIGFTKGEIKVYLALLELGNTTTGPLIVKSDVARSKVYEILEKLKGKGLATEMTRENIRYFQATSPERIVDYIKAKEKLLEEQELDFAKLLPQLVKMKKTAIENQEVKIYNGIEGLKTLYAEILEQLHHEDEYLAFTFSDTALEEESIQRFFHKFHQKRAAKGVPSRVLVNNRDRLMQKKFDFSDTAFYEIRKSELVLPTGIIIYRDSVITIIWGKMPKAFVVICKDNADRYKNFFDSVWKTAKRLK